MILHRYVALGIQTCNFTSLLSSLRGVMLAYFSILFGAYFHLCWTNFAGVLLGLRNSSLSPPFPSVAFYSIVCIIILYVVSFLIPFPFPITFLYIYV